MDDSRLRPNGASDLKYLNLLVLFLLYLLMSAGLFYQNLFTFNSEIIGGFGDARGEVWWLWAKLNGYLDGPVLQYIAAPFGVSLVNSVSQPIFEHIIVILAKLCGAIGGYNLFIILSFPLSSIAMFVFLSKVSHSFWPSFYGGFVFGFCPAAIAQATGGHLTFVFNAFLPIFALAFLGNIKQRSPLSALLLALAYMSVLLTSLYFGYYLAVFIVAMVFIDLISEPQQIWQKFKNYSLVAFITTLITLPFLYKEFMFQLESNSSALQTAGRIKSAIHLQVYSSRPWEFLLPSIDHFAFGSLVEVFLRSHLHGSNLYEQTLFLGFTPLLLLLMSCSRFNQITNIKLRKGLSIAFIGLFFSLFFSLPAEINIAGFKVPTISFFTFKIAPMFRVNSRLGIFVCFFLALAITYGLIQIGRTLTKPQQRAGILTILFLTYLEFYAPPKPLGNESLISPPPVYRWLAEQQGDWIVAEYPMVPADHAQFYNFLFWQQYHKKRLANGATPDNIKAWQSFEQIRHLNDPNTPRVLSILGVRYIIVHLDKYEEGPVPNPMKRYYPIEDSRVQYDAAETLAFAPELRLVKAFGRDLVFEVRSN